MKAGSSSRFFNSRWLLLTLVVGLSACYHREANLLVAPVPIQVDGSRVEGRGVPLVGPRWHRIEPGMTKDEVLHFVGEPTRRDYDDDFTNGNVESWYYDSYDIHDGHFDPHFVRFDRGRVISMGYDRARFEEKLVERKASARKAILAATVPDDVGQGCERDDQCQSKKCLSGRCAGPHECTRLRGDACTSNLDCCNGPCNMGGLVCD